MDATPSDVRLYVMLDDGTGYSPTSDGKYLYQINTERVQIRFRVNRPGDGIEVWFDNADVTRILDTNRSLDPS